MSVQEGATLCGGYTDIFMFSQVLGTVCVTCPLLTAVQPLVGMRCLFHRSPITHHPSPLHSSPLHSLPITLSLITHHPFTHHSSPFTHYPSPITFLCLSFTRLSCSSSFDGWQTCMDAAHAIILFTPTRCLSITFLLFVRGND